MTKKLQPKLRFRGFTDAWEQRKLGTLFVQANERNTDMKLSFKKTISVASMRFNPRGNGAAHSSLSAYKILRKGDIAFEGNRHHAHPFGQLVINDIGDGLMSARFQSVRPINPCIVSFWKYLLQNEKEMRRLLIRSTKAGTLMNEFVFGDFSRQSIPLPSEDEQKRIGMLFEHLDMLIAAEKRKLNLLRGKKSALLSQIFDQKMRFKGYTDPWEQRKLGEVCSITMGQSPNGKAYTTDSNYHILVQGNADIVDGWVRPRVWTKEVTKKAEAGDLILSVRAPVGAVAKTAFPVVLGRGVAGIDGGEYVYQFLRMLEERKYWRTIASGSTFDSVTKEQVAELPIEKPESRQEEHQIGVLLHTFDDLIAAESRKIDLLELKKKSLLQRMFV